MTVNIIGIDCATDPKKVGLASGTSDDDSIVVKNAEKPKRGSSVAEVVAGWIEEGIPTLLAIDAPLGWPAKLGAQLSAHDAGNPIAILPNELFRRTTDCCIYKRIGKLPLDVGADRIARTAHAALSILQELRILTWQSIPLAWDPSQVEDIAAIEVYPAATLKVSGLASSGYKKPVNRLERKEIIQGLAKHLQFNVDLSVLEEDDDVLDSAICVLAGHDFLSGKTIQPDDLALAKKEGWIWVREPV